MTCVQVLLSAPLHAPRSQPHVRSLLPSDCHTNTPLPSIPSTNAETFGRRIQDVNLLSVRKLHALHSQAAKLDAQITSRTAAMSRVSGDMASRPVSRRSIALTEAPGPSSCPASPGAGLMPSRGSRWGTGGGSPSAMTAWPAEQRPRPGTVGFRSSVGWEGLPDSPVDRTPLTIAERGTVGAGTGQARVAIHRARAASDRGLPRV